MASFAGSSFEPDLPKLQKQLQIRQEKQPKPNLPKLQKQIQTHPAIQTPNYFFTEHTYAPRKSTRTRPTKTSKTNPNSPSNSTPELFLYRTYPRTRSTKTSKQLQIQQESQPEPDLLKLQKQIQTHPENSTPKLFLYQTYPRTRPTKLRKLQIHKESQPDPPKLQQQLQTTREWNLPSCKTDQDLAVSTPRNSTPKLLLYRTYLQTRPGLPKLNQAPNLAKPTSDLLPPPRNSTPKLLLYRTFKKSPRNPTSTRNLTCILQTRPVTWFLRKSTPKLLLYRAYLRTRPAKTSETNFKFIQTFNPRMELDPCPAKPTSDPQIQPPKLLVYRAARPHKLEKKLQG